MTPDDLNGLIPNDEGDALAELAAAVPDDLAIVEVGSFRGKSTAYLASGAKSGAGAQVFAVDPWDLPGTVYGKHGYNVPKVREQFEEQLRAVKLWSRVTPIQAFSVDAAADWTGPKIGLLFIDGDHDRVVEDLAAWSEHLADDHVVALDDIDTPRNPKVREVADFLAANGYTLEVVAERLAVLRPVS
jgi:predicted O-methyltransferase YrrM